MAKHQHISSFTVLIIGLLFVSSLSYATYVYASSDTAEEHQLRLLYDFEGYAILAYSNLTPVKVRFEHVERSPGYSYSIYSRALINYVKGIDVYSNISRILEGVEMVKVILSCKYNVNSSDIMVSRSNDTIVITLPAGPCITAEPLLVLLEVKGRVYVGHSGNDTAFARIVVNATLPIRDGWKIVVDDPLLRALLCGSVEDVACTPRTIELSSPLYKIVGSEVYEESEKVGSFFPFYIGYPRNATEVKSVVENKAKLYYYNLSGSVYMVKYLKKFAKYGQMPEVREVSEIHVSLIDPLYISQVKAAMKYSSDIKYFIPNIFITGFNETAQLDNFIVDILLGKKPQISFTMTVNREEPPYIISVFTGSEPEVHYIYSYPTEMRLVPLKVLAPGPTGNSSFFLHIISLSNIRYEEIDPYSIYIGYYEVPREAADCWLCRWIPIVITLSALIATVALIAYFKKRRSS
jgi:hypothetical protein